MANKNPTNKALSDYLFRLRQDYTFLPDTQYILKELKILKNVLSSTFSCFFSRTINQDTQSITSSETNYHSLTFYIFTYLSFYVFIVLFIHLQSIFPNRMFHERRDLAIAILFTAVTFTPKPMIGNGRYSINICS